MEHCIVQSGNCLLHLHSRIMVPPGSPGRLPLLAVEFYVSLPSSSHRQEALTFYFDSLPTAMPYHHWVSTVENMILTAAGHNAPALPMDQLVHDFCVHTGPALVGFHPSPGHFLFFSSVVEVATAPPPRRFYYFPFPGADLRVSLGDFHPLIEEADQSGGGTPAPASPIRGTIESVIHEAAAEGDGESPCAICLEEFEAGEVLDELLCGHRFHPGCIVEWLQKRPTCPLCRMPMALDQQ